MNRVVLVTGASRGIGRDAAITLADLGWTVYGTLRSDVGRPGLESAGVGVIPMDVTDPDAVRAGVARVVAEAGRLDAVVANAGQGLFGCFETLADEQIRRVMEINFFGVLHSAREALPHLRANRGRLVIVSSVAGRRALPGGSAYAASKFAVEGWAEALSHELRPFGVSVTLIEPGPTRTGFFEHRRRGGRDGPREYEPLTARLDRLQERMLRRCVPVEVVTRAIVRALTRPNPPLRIPTGRGSKLQLLAGRILPDRAWNAIVAGIARFQV